MLLSVYESPASHLLGADMVRRRFFLLFSVARVILGGPFVAVLVVAG